MAVRTMTSINWVIVTFTDDGGLALLNEFGTEMGDTEHTDCLLERRLLASGR